MSLENAHAHYLKEKRQSQPKTFRERDFRLPCIPVPDGAWHRLDVDLVPH